jgi:hypothetical protein
LARAAAIFKRIDRKEDLGSGASLQAEPLLRLIVCDAEFIRSKIFPDVKAQIGAFGGSSGDLLFIGFFKL